MRIRSIVVLFFAIAAATARGASIAELTKARDSAAVVREFPRIAKPTEKDRALYVEALSGLYRHAEAHREAEKLMRDTPSSPWAWYARAAVEGDEGLVDEAMAYTARMLELAGPEPDDRLVTYRAFHLQYVSRFDEAIALLDSRPPSLAIRLSQIITVISAETKKEGAAAALKAGIIALQQLVEENPDAVGARMHLAHYLRFESRLAEAYAQAKRAAELTQSLPIHWEYWVVMSRTPDLSAAQRLAVFEEDIASLQKTRGEWPELWNWIARGYDLFEAPERAEEWRARVLREAPDSVEAAITLYDQAIRFLRRNPASRTDPALRAQLVALYRAALAHPGQGTLFRDQAGYNVIKLLQEDATTSTEELLAAVDAATGLKGDPRRAADVAVLLADRKVRLEQALKLARTAIAAADAEIRLYDMEGDRADGYRAIGRDALGWALLKSGDLPAARTQLLAAVELSPSVPQYHYHLGQWYEASGHLALAEKAYQRGMAQQSMATNPNQVALTALYMKRDGASRASEQAKKSRATASEMRRREVLATRAASPAAAPPFRLQSLDGKAVDLQSLKGKVMVVNFWGIWCGWCVEELPEVQDLAKKYARDAGVAILTINNDGNPERVRDWMRSKKYDFPVLIDAGFAVKQNVLSWPTTWFIDRDGRLAFKQQGWTEHLLEEFSWRIDALRR